MSGAGSVRAADEFQRQEVSSARGTARQVLIGPEQGPNFALRRFIMGPGGGMPKHINDVEHEQYVLRGRARVAIGDSRGRTGRCRFHPRWRTPLVSDDRG